MTAATTAASPTRAALRRTAPALAVAMLLANVLGYAAAILLSRLLGPEPFGALGAVFGVLAVLSVPGLALQQVVARRVAVRDDVSGLVRQAGVMGLALGAVCAAATPLLMAFLHLPSAAALLWTSAALVPLPLASALQGVLQGQERFYRLGGLFVAAAGLRLVLPVAAVAAGLGVTGALAATAGANVAWAALGLVIARPAGGGARTRSSSDLAREVVAVVGVVGGLLVLANLDLLLARHHLPATQAGHYAVGSLVTKIVFWGPQFVAVAVLPRLADPEQRARVLPAALAMVVGMGVLAVSGAAVLGGPLVDLLLGDAYSDLAPVAWRFALLGALLVTTQLLLTSGVAARSRGLALPLLAAAAVEVALVARWHDSTTDVVTAAIVACALLTAVALLRELVRLRARLRS